MASVISLKNGLMQEVEEELVQVLTAMREGGAYEWHVANGTHGWQPAGEHGPLILIRGEEVAAAYAIPTLPNPLDKRR